MSKALGKMPRWQKAVIAAIVAFVALFLIVLVAGAPAATEAGMDSSTVEASTALTDAQKSLYAQSAQGAVYQEAVAGAEAAGTLANLSYYDAAKRQSCRVYTRSKTARNLWGGALFRTYMRVHFCWQGHKLTYAPHSDNWRVIYSLGALTQWEADGSDRWDSWNLTPHNSGGDDFAGHAVAAYYKRCIPSPFGCVKVGSATHRIHLVTYAGGHIAIVQ
jgi:hypothetical protein